MNKLSKFTSLRTIRITRQTSAIQYHRKQYSTPASNKSALSAAITKDHRELEEYHHNIINAPNDDDATGWQNQFTWELTRHSIAEELVVYPAFEKNLGSKGQQMADRDCAEHQTVKEKLKNFQSLEAGTPEFIPALESLMTDLKQHIKEEETSDLVALDASLSTSESEIMAKTFGRTKAFVPSRSHPLAPNKPPFETVVGLMTAPLDHLGDMLRKFPDKTASPNPSTK